VKEELTLTTLRYLDLPPSLRDFVEFSPDESRALEVVNQKVAAGGSLAEVMDLVFDATREICPCDRIGVAFLEDGGRLVSKWVRTAYEPVLLGAGYAESVRGSSLEEVISSGRPRVIADLEAYLVGHPASASTALLVREGVRSSMTCPLSVEGRPVGVMFRSSRRPNAYDEHQVRLHLAIAERLSQAVEKAWRIDRLAAANRAYAEVLAFVGNQLDAALASMAPGAAAVAGGMPGGVDPAHTQLVGRAASRSRHLLTLLRDHLGLGRAEGGALEADDGPRVDLVADVIEPALAPVAAELGERGSRLVRDFPAGPVPVRGDPDLLRLVVANLLGAAASHGARGRDVSVTVRRNRASFSVSVRFEGRGFTKNELPRLFQGASRLRTKEPRSGPGSAAALYTCRRIVELHGGRTSAASLPGRWARLTFTIPIPPTAS